jgi:hypothetical protein
LKQLKYQDMKKLFITLGICLIGSVGWSQINQDFLVPHLNIGTGMCEMKEINNVVGFGYDIGYDFQSTGFGISGFYNMNRISARTEELPMFREEYGTDDMIIKNRSRASTYGVKLRYTPPALQYSRVTPYAELGGGFATHTSVWRSPGKQVMIDDSDPNCPKYEYQFRDRGVQSRSTTMIGVGEVGMLIRLYGAYPNSHQMRNNNDRAGWYLGLSARLEYGGEVQYRLPGNNPYQFNYDSGLGAQNDQPYAHLTPSGASRDGNLLGRHQMFMFQVSLVRTIF